MQKTFKDLTGQKFGDYTALEYIGDSHWKCQCKCGEIKNIHRYSLLHREPMYCNHKKYTCEIPESDKNIELERGKKFGLYLGKKFGEWEVIGDIDNKYKVPCRCSCGKERSVNFYTLRDGRSTGCGHTMNQDRVEDLTGRVFGDLTVLNYAGNQMWNCQCSCGNIVTKHRTHLLDGRAHSCGHGTNKEPTDIRRQKFGKLTPIKYVGNKNWLCQCDCGKTKVIAGFNLRNGSTVSCGCIQYTPTKEELIDKATEYANKFGRKPSIRDLSDYIGVTYGVMQYHVHKYGLQNSEYMDTVYASDGERDLWRFINSIYKGEVQHNVKNLAESYELDIYIPDKQLAIEFNGDYWHSDLNKDPSYHQRKSIAFGKKGIRVIHIFEHEWSNTDRRVKIQNFLKNIISDDKKVLYARNLEVKLIDSNTAIKFEDNYHLQGGVSSSINLGLFDSDKLVGVMTFGRPRFSNNHQYEIYRIAFINDINIVGGSEKLFRYFIKNYNPKSIISYCDLSKFSGKVYQRLGFKLFDEGITKPGYCWVDPINLSTMSRYSTTKQKLVDSGLGSMDQTEDEIMKSQGYLKIYDCGNLKFEYRQ